MSRTTSGPRAVPALCRDRHCRVALAVLATEDRTLTLNDLTKAIVEHANGDAITEVAGDDVARIQRDLAAVHVPRMVDAALVEYDATRGLVTPATRLSAYRSQVSAAVEDDADLDGPLDL